jgi:hypothetical protein
MRAIVAADPDAVHGALARLGYLGDAESYDPVALLDHLATASEWFLAEGFRKIDPVVSGAPSSWVIRHAHRGSR